MRLANLDGQAGLIPMLAPDATARGHTQRQP